MSIMPIQKAGKDASIMASVVPMASQKVYCFTAASTPSATPITTPISVAPAASVTVTGKRAITVSNTPLPLSQLLPRLPWQRSQIYFA